jgi:hypothetical protein
MEDVRRKWDRPFRTPRKPISDNSSIENSIFAQFILEEIPQITGRETSSKLRHKYRPRFGVILPRFIIHGIIRRRLICRGFPPEM